MVSVRSLNGLSSNLNDPVTTTIFHWTLTTIHLSRGLHRTFVAFYMPLLGGTFVPRFIFMGLGPSIIGLLFFIYSAKSHERQNSGSEQKTEL